MQYLGEKFNKEECRRTCDNCRNQGNIESEARDVTTDAQKLIALAREMGENITMSQLLDVFRGSAKSTIINKGWDSLPLYGTGMHYAALLLLVTPLINVLTGDNYTKMDAQRLLRALAAKGVFVEKTVANKMGYPTTYIHVLILLSFYLY